MNLNSFDLGGRSQSEMKALVRARSVAAAADQVSALANTSGRHKDLRANGIPRTLPSANQFESEPMVVVLHDVSEEHRCRIHVVQDNIGVAVVEEIGRASCRERV